jgi:hypothetical protein
MTRWGARILGLLILLVFILLMLNLQRQLRMLQEMRSGGATTTATTGT